MATKRIRSRKIKRKSRRGGFGRFFRRGNSSANTTFIEENYTLLNTTNIKPYFDFMNYRFIDWNDNFLIARGKKIYMGNLTKNDGKYYLRINVGNKYYNKHLLIDPDDIIYLPKKKPINGMAMKHIDKLRKIVSNRSPSKINDVYYEYTTDKPYEADEDTPEYHIREDNNIIPGVGSRENPNNNFTQAELNEIKRRENNNKERSENYLSHLMKSSGK